MKPFILFLCLTLALLTGCERDTAQPQQIPEKPLQQAPVATDGPIGREPAVAPAAEIEDIRPEFAAVRLLHDPAETILVELPTAALPFWRQKKESAPALVLLSQDPLLAPIPPALEQEVLQLLHDGTDAEILTRTAKPVADPLLLPSMAVSAAQRARLFSQVIWILPSKQAAEQLDLEIFLGQMLDLGAIDSAEADSFNETGLGMFAGVVGGLPFQAVHLDALPELTRPVVVHFDPSFLKPLYRGEIKTPLYPLLAELLGKLRDRNWQTVGASVSRSSLNGSIPLPSRFVSVDVARLFEEPRLFEADMPRTWDLRARALYLENFLKKEEVRELYEEMEARTPEDPSVKYALYQVLRQFKEVNAAMVKLDEAVRLDPVYALEYLSLAEIANEKNLVDQVERMLRLAVSAMPDHPFLQLRLAGYLQTTGQDEEAEKLLTKLREKPWSPVYYPDMVKQLD
ncbi:MAG: hypothetical protein RQ723_10890 [Desulfuromonadales bacterium]|nr:hypothetical protein [Desulfuromonadales bacterium]